MTPSKERIERAAEAIWLEMNHNKDVVMNAVDGKNPNPTPAPYVRMAAAALTAAIPLTLEEAANVCDYIFIDWGGETYRCAQAIRDMKGM